MGSEIPLFEETCCVKKENDDNSTLGQMSMINCQPHYKACSRMQTNDPVVDDPCIVDETTKADLFLKREKTDNSHFKTEVSECEQNKEDSRTVDEGTGHAEASLFPKKERTEELHFKIEVSEHVECGKDRIVTNLSTVDGTTEADLSVNGSECGQVFQTEERLTNDVSSVDERSSVTPDGKGKVSENQDSGNIIPKFKCSICEIFFSSSHDLKEHMVCHKRNIFPCHLCDKMFRTERTHHAHMQIHNGMHPYTCSICSKALSCFSALKKHVKTHNESIGYKCEVCERVYSTPYNLKDHMLIHGDEKTFSCGMCGKTFFRAMVLKSHMLCHLEQRTHKCRICRKGFKTSGKRNVHEKIHSFQKKVQCGICKKDVKYLDNHMKVHTRAGAFKCELCEKGFSSMTLLKGHYETLQHGGNMGKKRPRPLVCDLCGLTLASEYTLKSHKLTVHATEKPFKCTLCQKSFAANWFLQKHIRLSHSHNAYRRPIDRDRRFVCGVCGKEYRTRRCLEAHVVLHSTGRSFVCNVCYILCFTQAQLDTHMASHPESLRIRTLQKEIGLVTDCTQDKPKSGHNESKPGQNASKPGAKKMSGAKNASESFCTICEKHCKTTSILAVHMRSRHPGQKPFKCSNCDQAFVVYEHLQLHTSNKH